MSEKRICSNCKNAFEGKFCPECGTKWEEPPAVAAAMQDGGVTAEENAQAAQPFAAKDSVPASADGSSHAADSTSLATNDTPPASDSVPDATDDTPRSLDGKPALLRAHSLTRWIRALSLGLLLFGIGSAVNLVIPGASHSGVFAEIFKRQIIITCVALALGVAVYFIPVKNWRPEVLQPRDERTKSVGKQLWDWIKPISLDLDAVCLLSSLITCETVIITAIAWISDAVYNELFVYSIYILILAGCGLIGVAAWLIYGILKRRESELRLHFYGIKKPVKDMPLLHPFNEQKELAFLSEYKKNASALTRYPTGTVEVMPKKLNAIFALIMVALSVVYLSVHSAIFSPYNVGCLDLIALDRSVGTNDIMLYVGNNKAIEENDKIIFIKSEKVRTTFTFTDGLTIEYDCDYDQEKGQNASYKEIAQRKLRTETKAFCGIPTQDKIIMSCYYTDGSYRKFGIAADKLLLQDDILLPNRMTCAMHDSWEEMYYLSFEKVDKLMGESLGVEYQLTGQYDSASLILGGKAEVKRKDARSGKEAYWLRFYPVVAKITVKSGLYHSEPNDPVYGPYRGMTALQTAVIEKGVKGMPANAFGDSKGLKTVWCEETSAPENWNENWLGDSKAVVHWGDEWEYVNGVPTLKTVEE